jgi:hypothetical protein
MRVLKQRFYEKELSESAGERYLSIICSEIENENYKSTIGTFSWFEMFQKLLNALKHRVTIWHKNNRLRPTLSPSLRLLIKHKHYLQNKYRNSKLEVDRLRLQFWEKLLQHEFQQFKADNWHKFLEGEGEGEGEGG